jgi:hypothetical protein
MGLVVTGFIGVAAGARCLLLSAGANSGSATASPWLVACPRRRRNLSAGRTTTGRAWFLDRETDVRSWRIVLQLPLFLALLKAQGEVIRVFQKQPEIPTQRNIGQSVGSTRRSARLLCMTDQNHPLEFAARTPHF